MWGGKVVKVCACVCVCGVGLGGEGDGGSVFFREQQLAAELRNEDSLVP